MNLCLSFFHSSVKRNKKKVEEEDVLATPDGSERDKMLSTQHSTHVFLWWDEKRRERE